MKEPMQRIVEAAGECWHEYNYGMGCHKCKLDFVDRVANPSRTDYGELIRLMKKIFAYYALTIDSGGFTILKGKVKTDSLWVDIEIDGVDADALLNALDQAIGGSDE